MKPFDHTIEWGWLTPIENATQKPKHRSTVWRCRCRCGNVVDVYQYNLRSGQTRSCGCYQKARLSEAVKTHGMAGSRVYRAWQEMLRRCHDPKRKSYKDYGGRGIKVCERWRHSFENFSEDMGPIPSLKHEIERKDHDGDYTPENCVWATDKEQGRNKRNNRMVTHNGKTQCVSAWAEETGIRAGTIWFRLKSGWSVSDALTKPLIKGRPKK